MVPVARDESTVALIEHAGQIDPEALRHACTDLSAVFDSEREMAALRARMRALERTEQRLLEVFETLELIVAVMGLDATLTYANPYTTRISGWSRSEMLGQNWFQMFRSGRESFLERVRKGDFPPRDQSIIVTRFGERREIDWYNVPLRDDDGRITGILGMGRDRTDERRARRSLEASERRMRDVFDTVELIVGQIDMEGRLTYVNEYLVRLSGWTREELLGADYFKVFRTGNEAFLERVRSGEFAPYDQSTVVLRSGERRDIDWANVGLYDDDGNLTGIVGIGRDVTDQLRAEREARDLAAEHEALERVATAVAQGLEDEAVFPLVAEQAGRLVGADGCTLLRFPPGDQAMISSNWSHMAADQVTPEGRVVPIDSGPAMAAMYRSGRWSAPISSRRRPAVRTRRDSTTPSARRLPRRSPSPARCGGRWWPGASHMSRCRPTRSGGWAHSRRWSAPQSRTPTRARRSRPHASASLTAGDEARRRLERNLHDGAQQRFVSLALALRLALTQLESAPAAAAEQLRAALEELSLGLEELRELARGIHPAILTEHGLEAAVESLVTRSPVPVEVVDVPGERLPPEVEAAAYYVVSEALTNVARYAEASLATVAISLDDGRVRIEVTDDGKGGANAGEGSGLRGLSDRIEATDGRLVVESPPGGGTRIVAITPCSSGPAPAHQPG